MTEVVVIGAGVIGLSCAYSLRRRGLEVTILDRERSGVGASWGNTGWITPGLSTPLPGPEVRAMLPRWLLWRSGPLTIRPFSDPGLPRWLWRFWRHCTARDYSEGLSVLAALNERTDELYDALEADGVATGMDRRGVLLACRTPHKIDQALRDAKAAVADAAMAVRVLDRDGVLDAEPALHDVAGGVLIETDRHVRAETLCAGLTAHVQQLGVRLVFGEEAVGVLRRGRRVTHVVGRTARRAADVVILAAGAWSGRLAHRMEFRLPIQAGKGYSITLANPSLRLRRPVYLAEAKIALSPYRDVLRASGTLELTGLDPSIDSRRLARMRSTIGSFLPWANGGAPTSSWAGLRPLTPDGLPAVGRAPGLDNVYVATGHAMLGMTLAPATGELLAALVVEGRVPDPVLDRLDPIRFN
jgi:D-amino-acid dehydrogenase